MEHQEVYPYHQGGKKHHHARIQLPTQYLQPPSASQRMGSNSQEYSLEHTHPNATHTPQSILQQPQALSLPSQDSYKDHLSDTTSVHDKLYRPVLDHDKARNSDHHQHHSPRKRRSSSSSNPTPGSKAFQDTVNTLKTVKVVYPLNEIPEDMLRFIPDSQRSLIRPLLSLRGNDPLNKDPFITKRKYATNVDERAFLSVYEFQINDHWIIWDYHTGFVFFTGLWKAAGNTKTDIVKMVENIPSISSQVRRVRGGFLKIQGTWLPFETCKMLAKNFAFPIRYCLVPLFGAIFPDECLKPGDAHYGKLVDLNDPPLAKTRRRSSNISPKDAVPNRVAKPVGIKKRSHSDNVIVTSSASRKGSAVPLLEMEEVLKASKQLHDLSTCSSGLKCSDGITRGRQLSFNYGGFVWSWQDENNLTILGKDEEAIMDDEEEINGEIPDDNSSVTASSGRMSISRNNSFVWAKQLQNLTLNPTSPFEENKSMRSDYYHHISPSSAVGTGSSSSSSSLLSSSALTNTTTPLATAQYITTTSIEKDPHTPESIHRQISTDSIPKTYNGGFDSILNAAQQLMTFSSGAHQNQHSESSVRDTPISDRSDGSRTKRMEIGGLLGATL